jgi:diguanylate cyclase (GGDEF)-like protein
LPERTEALKINRASLAWVVDHVLANSSDESSPTTMSSNRPTSKPTGYEGFQHSLGLLDVIKSRQLLCGAILILLLPVTIALVSFPSELVQLQNISGLDWKLLVGGLVGIIWVVSALMLAGQQHRLNTLRKSLINQIDNATKNQVRAERFYGLSILDPLTGLYNRRFGENRLQEEIARAEASKDPLLLVALDFDRFKETNDKYGHAAGDLALKEFSRRLQRAIRACDVPIRVGGDEFLVILPECPPEKINAILSRMDSIEFALDEKMIPVSFSHGMAQYQVNDTPETLIKRADERLYIAKANRKAAATADKNSTTEAAVRVKNPGGASVQTSETQRISGTPARGVRRSGRLPKKMTVLLVGSNLEGRAFSEKTSTVNLSRHGAAVVSQHKLASEQHVIIRCLDTKMEAEARVVRIAESQTKNHIYGLEFLTAHADFWGADVSPLIGYDDEASRLVIEQNAR